MMNVTGSCLCGDVTYEVRLPFLRFVNCHCSRCRHASGERDDRARGVPLDARGGRGSVL